jgi:hypothetical protein
VCYSVIVNSGAIYAREAVCHCFFLHSALKAWCGTWQQQHGVCHDCSPAAPAMLISLRGHYLSILD